MLGMGRGLAGVDARGAPAAMYRTHCGRVRWVLRARGVPEHWLEDAVHDAFVAILARFPHRDEAVPLDQWICGIARNVAFTQRRTLARRARVLAALPNESVDTGASPEETLSRTRAWAALRRFLEELDDAQREVFVLAEILGMRIPEVAALGDAPLNTLYSRLRLARKRFSDRFGPAAPQALLEGCNGAKPSPAVEHRGWVALATGIPSFRPTAAWPTWVPAVSQRNVATWLVAAAATVGGVLVVEGDRRPIEDAGVRDRSDARPDREDAPGAAALATTTTAAALPPIARRSPSTDEGSGAGGRARARSPAPTAAREDDAGEGGDLAATTAALLRAKRALTRGDTVAARNELDAVSERARRGPLRPEFDALRRELDCSASRRTCASADDDGIP